MFTMLELSSATIIGLALAATGAHAGLVQSERLGPIVTVNNGSYSGVYSSSFHQEFFLGMPFAQPPVGNLRFKIPEPLNTSWIGTRNATEYGHWCPGHGEDNGYNPNEDCLTINVVRPAGYQGQKLPVAAWIYGGGFWAGGSADDKYNLSYTVQNSVAMGKPIIALSMNYRVGAWGFMKSTDLVAEGSTNVGMRDQRLALQWVHENIAAFGGDPAKVTIWGESAGAFAVGFHLTAYGGRDDGLFRGAIAESGNPLYLGHATWSESQRYYDNASITALASCSTAADHLACLRAVPYDSLNEIFENTWGNIFFPQPDGDFIQGSTLKQMIDGRFVKVPFLIGANTDEGTAFLPYAFNTDDDLLTYVTSQGPDRATAHELLKFYPDIPAIGIPDSVHVRPNISEYGLQYKRACAYNGDYYFIAGRRFTAGAWNLHNVTSYSYRFNTAPYNGGPDYTSVTHGAELAFVFDITSGNAYRPNPIEGMPQSYYHLAKTMSRMWVAFVHDLDPNGHGVAGQPTWPVYSALDGYGQNMVFDANVSNHVEPDTFRAEAIAYLQNAWPTQYGYGDDDTNLYLGTGNSS